MKVKSTRKFDKQLAKLDKSIHGVFVKKLYLLQENIKHPSLHVEKLNTMLYSFRVNKNFRVIFTYENGHVILLLTVANHDVYRKIKNFL